MLITKYMIYNFSPWIVHFFTNVFTASHMSFRELPLLPKQRLFSRNCNRLFVRWVKVGLCMKLCENVQFIEIILVENVEIPWMLKG